MINNCVLVGRIARDPEMRYTTSGMAVVNFRIAVTRQRRSGEGEEQTDWLDVVAFGKTGEFVAQYLDTGALIGIEGRIQSRTWKTQDGQARYAVEIVANSVQALESRQEAERRRAAKGTAAPSGAPARGPVGQPPAGPGAPPAGPSQPPAGPSQPPAGQGAPPAGPGALPTEDYGPISEDEDPFGDQ